MRHLRDRYLPEGSLRARLARGAFWATAGSLASQFLRLSGIVVVARLTGVEAFGEFGMVLSSLGLVAGIGGLGLGISVAKHVAELRDGEGERVGGVIGLSLLSGLALGVAAGALFWAVAPTVGNRLLGSEAIVPSLRIGSLWLVLASVEGVLANVLVGFESFRVLARVQFLKGAAELPLVALLTYRWGTEGAVAGLTASAGVASLLNYELVRAECRTRGIQIRTGLGSGNHRGVLSFGVAAYLGSLFIQPALWAGSALLVNQAGGYLEMGIFTAADKWRIALLFLPVAVSRTYLPVFTNLLASGEVAKIRKGLRVLLCLTAGVTAVMVVVSTLLSDSILRLFGSGFTGRRTVLLILSASAIPMALNTTLGSVLLSLGQAWTRFGFDILLALLFVFFTLLLVPGWKAEGLSLAYLVSFVVPVAGMAACAIRCLEHESES